MLDNGHGAATLDDLGSNGTAFYAALLAQASRWYAFTDRGAKASLPQEDRRYTATANALMTMYMNTDRGLIPSYGGGQFWNEYNVWIPLNTLALVGALLRRLAKLPLGTAPAHVAGQWAVLHSDTVSYSN